MSRARQGWGMQPTECRSKVQVLLQGRGGGVRQRRERRKAGSNVSESWRALSSWQLEGMLNEPQCLCLDGQSCF